MKPTFDYSDLILKSSFCYPSLANSRMSLSSNSSESVVENQGKSSFVKETKKSRKKQYHCDQCFKIFNRPSALKTHIYTHTGEKPYSCSRYIKLSNYAMRFTYIKISFGCNRRFSVISNLRRHLKVHKKPVNLNKIFPEKRERSVKRLMDRIQPEGLSVDLLNESLFSYNNIQSFNYSDTLTTRFPAIQNVHADYSTMLRNSIYPMNNSIHYNNSFVGQIPTTRSIISLLERDIHYTPVFYL